MLVFPCLADGAARSGMCSLHHMPGTVLQLLLYALRSTVHTLAAASSATAHPPTCLPEHCPTQTFLVGPKFMGVKMVPPGTHLVAYNSASGQGDFGPTTCFFATIKSGQVGCMVHGWLAAMWHLKHGLCLTTSGHDKAAGGSFLACSPSQLCIPPLLPAPGPGAPVECCG